MPHPPLAIAVVMQRSLLNNRWQSEKWEPVAVLPDGNAPGTPPRLLRDDERTAQWLYSGFRLRLFHDEAEGYYLNLFSPRPYVFVNWREEEGRAVPQSVTASYHEAARMMDGGSQVDGVPMPADWQAWLASYVQENYKPEEKKKRARPPSFKGAKRDE
jgi:hypothetical protein